MSNELPPNLDQGIDNIKKKIRHTLSVYPRLSPSMLQIGIGTAVSPDIWRPILEAMIRDGEVISEDVPAPLPQTRARSHTVLSLTARPVLIQT